MYIIEGWLASLTAFAMQGGPYARMDFEFDAADGRHRSRHLSKSSRPGAVVGGEHRALVRSAA